MNYHIVENSPCHDTGDPNAWLFPGEEHDIDWLQAVNHGDRVFGECVDIGADEYEPWLGGDANCDGVRSYADIGAFLAALSGQANYYAVLPDCSWLNSDMNCDGVVSYADIGQFNYCLGHLENPCSCQE